MWLSNERGRRAADTLAPPPLTAAHHYCARVMRASDSSFAAPCWMLPRPKRQALAAIYAFCRLADDIADDPLVRGDRRQLLTRWRDELAAAYAGTTRHPVGIALAQAVTEYRLPQEIFRDLLSGIEADLQGQAMNAFDDVRRYCYQVASTIGLLVVRVLGFRNPASLDYAVAMGIAVQLTNVLRDVGADAAAGRIYLAREDLERMGVRPAQLQQSPMSDELRLLLALYAERARIYYERAAQLLPAEDRRSLWAAEAMGRIYRTLLDELQRRRFPCLDGTLRLSKRRRLAIATSVWFGIGATA